MDRGWVCAPGDGEIAELDWLTAGRADDGGVERRSAAVSEFGCLNAPATPAVSPLLERQQDGRELAAGVGEQVLVAWRVLAVAAAVNDSPLDQPRQAAREDASRYAYLCGKVNEAAVAVEELAHDLERVAIAYRR